MTISIKLANHGFGAATETHSLTGVFDSRTRTVPHDGHQRMGNSGVREPVLLEDSKLAPVDLVGMGSYDSTMRAVLASTHQDNFTSRLSNPHIFRQLVQDDRYFPAATCSVADKRVLQETISKLEGTLPDTGTSKELAGAELAVLTQALAAACRKSPFPAVDAARGLACLRNLDLKASIRTPAAATVAAAASHAHDPGNKTNNCPNVGVGVAPCLHTAAAFDQRDLGNAWRIAQQLETTPTGFDLLKKITAHAAPIVGPGGRNLDLHASHSRFEDEMLHVHLQATREIANEVHVALGANIDPDPASIHVRLNRSGGPIQRAASLASPLPPGVVSGATLLEKAILGTQNYFTQLHTHTTKLTAELNAAVAGVIRNPVGDPAVAAAEHAVTTTPFVSAKDANHWAVRAVQNQLYSDRTGTDFSRLSSRVDKLSVWVDRATGDAGRKRRQKFARAIKRFVAPLLDKSPFNAFNRLGDGWGKRNGIGFGNSVQGATQEGRIIKEVMMSQVQNGLTSHGNVDGMPNAPAAPLAPPIGAVNVGGKNLLSRRTLTNVVRLAILNQHKVETVFLNRFTTMPKLDDAAIAKAKAGAYAMLAGGRRAQDAEGERTIDTLFRTQNDSMTAEILMKWAADISGAPNLTSPDSPLPPPPRVPLAAGQPDWHAFGQAVDNVVRGNAVPMSIVNHDGKSPNLNIDITHGGGGQRQQLAEIFEEAIKRQEVGGAFEFSSGGVVGVKTGDITEVVSGLVSAGALRFSGNLALDRYRLATLQAGTSTDGNALIFGSQTVHKSQATVGASIGPGKLSKKTNGVSIGMGVGGDLGGGCDFMKQKAVVFRFPRVYTALDGDAVNNAKLGLLSRKLIDPAHPPAGHVWQNAMDPADATSALKNALQEFDDLSVNWLTNKEDSVYALASIGAGAGIAVGNVRQGFAGINVAANIKQTWGAWKEKGGSLHVERDSSASSTSISASGLVSSVAGAIPNLTKGQIVGFLNVSGIGVGSGAVQLYRSGTNTCLTKIDVDNKFHKSSFKTVAHPNARAFVVNVAPRLAEMAIDKVRKQEPEKFNESVTSHDAAINREYNKLREHVYKSVTNQTMSHSFLEYYEPKDEVVEAVNKYRSLAKGADHMGDNKRFKDCQDGIDKMLKDDKSFEWAFIADSNTEFDQRTRGVNFLGKNQQFDMATFSNLRDFS